LEQQANDRAVDLPPKSSENSIIMATPAFSEIENEFVRLSPEAQLTLLERLVHRTRVAVSGNRDSWEADLSTMAADPEMQCELKTDRNLFFLTLRGSCV
jgi:hypothetical protein